MTKIVGTIRDVELEGLSGLLIAWSGFRPTTTTVIAPKRRVWQVEAGVLPDDVDVAPGPAVIQLDFGPSAFKSWPVEIPNTEQVSIQELLFHSLSWGPAVPLPPPSEVADLLALIAQTAQEYETTLQGEVNAALAAITAALAESQRHVIDGKEDAEAAEGHMAAALQAAQDALDHAEHAQALVGQADDALEATQTLRDEAAGVQSQIEALNAQIGNQAASIDAAVVDGLAAASAAAASAAQASTLAGEAASINQQIAGHLANAQAAVAEGERQVLWAQEHAVAAEDKAQEASGYADQAAMIVANAGDTLASTEEARDAAQSALTTIEGIGTEVDQIQTRVLGLHQEVLERHDEVLEAHGEAITAAGNAASAAGTAASEAAAAASDAGSAAQAALDATAAHTAALEVQEGVNARLAEAVTAASDAADSAGEAAGKALEATQAQTAINEMQGQINADLVAVDALHGEVLDRHDVVLAMHGEAIDAAAAASTSAGTAASEAAAAAQEAIDATAAHSAALAVQEQVNLQLIAATGKASDAAESARLAADAAAEAQESFADYQEQINQDVEDRIALQAQLLEAVREAQAASLFERWYVELMQGYDGLTADHVTVDSGGSYADHTIRATGNWTGELYATGAWGTGTTHRTVAQKYDVPGPAGERVFTLERPGQDPKQWLRLDYSVSPGTQIVDNRPGGEMELAAENTWYEVPGARFTVPADIGTLAITFDVGWDNASFTPAYRHRIRVLGGAELAKYDRYNIGPVFGGAYRKRSVTASGVALQPGQEVVFEVNSAANGASYRKVRDTLVRITYVQMA